MNNLVEINNIAIGIKEYEGKRVITFRDIDKVHERPDGTARKAFNRNKKRFINGEDYFVHERDEAKQLFGIIAPSGVTTVTESGYLMISKVFDDDIAWEVQRKLVDSYFRIKESAFQDPTIAAIQMIAENMKLMQQDISTLKEQQTQIQKALPKKKLSYWARKMFPKYDLLMDYFNVTRTKLYNNLYIELQNRYPDIDLNQIQEDYCYENGIESCYTMDVIEHTKDVRTRFENMVEELLNRYDLKEKEAESLNKETIFV